MDQEFSCLGDKHVLHLDYNDGFDYYDDYTTLRMHKEPLNNKHCMTYISIVILKIITV